tara:strand:+ start:395 stop:1051 length:657 start_codon:yes stop_codon:yes gene_type:complete
MKKLIIAILGLSLFCFSVNAFERKIGFSASMAMLDTTVTDDIDSNGSIDTTKDISNDVIIPSLFLEFATDLPNGGKAAFGVDYIPMSAELESRSTTQNEDGGTNGTNSGTLDASNHVTAYVTLGGDVAGNHVFALAGMMYAEGEYDLKSVSSTNRTGDVNIQGTKLGIGIERDMGEGFMRVVLSDNDYDPVSATTSNATKVTADIDSTNLTVSFGRSF